MLLIQRAFKKKMFILKCKIRAVDVNREGGLGHGEGGGGALGTIMRGVSALYASVFIIIIILVQE